MDFALTEEQQLIIKTTRDFVQRELYPWEREIEDTGALRKDLWRELKAKAIKAGLYAANMPTEVGGGGLDAVSWALYEKELGRTSFVLHYSCVARPSNILLACEGAQRERYLLPTVRGDKAECLAISEPDAGSDVRGMKTTAVQQGGDFLINGTKHFISHADHADFVILFAATGEEQTPRGKRKLITSFLVDMDTPGFEVRPGYRNVSHRGYTNSILQFNDCRVPKSAMLGAPKVKDVRGFSDFGFSYVYIIFEQGTDIYWARSRTLEYLSQVHQLHATHPDLASVAAEALSRIRRGVLEELP